MMKTLCEIVVCPCCKADKPLHYLDFYEELFSRIEIKYLLEVGVQTGNSLRMFSERLPNATIVGVDVQPVLGTLPSNCVFVRGNIKHLKTLEDVKLACSTFDLIIDDASHRRYQTEKTFRVLFSLLRSEGCYVIEDFAAFTEVPKWEYSSYFCPPQNNVDLIKSLIHELAIWKGSRRNFGDSRFKKIVIIENLVAIIKR